MVLSLLLCCLTLGLIQEAAVEGGPSKAECLVCLHCASFTPHNYTCRLARNTQNNRI